MIIKKKYTTIKKNSDIEENIIPVVGKDNQEELEFKDTVNNKTEEINKNSNPDSREIKTSKQKNNTEEKKTDESFDLSLDNIIFEQREERREGSRRRGYRRTQDRNIVSRAQEDAKSIKEIAKQEGYNEGLNQAQKDIDEIKTKFSEFYNYKDEVFQKVSECIMDISIEIAKKIIKNEIEADNLTIIPIIKDVLKEVNKTEEKITLKVMPKDVDIVREKLPEIFSGDSFEAKIIVVPDANIKEGGVIVETSNGIVDATIESQMKIIEKALNIKEER